MTTWKSACVHVHGNSWYQCRVIYIYIYTDPIQRKPEVALLFCDRRAFAAGLHRVGVLLRPGRCAGGDRRAATSRAACVDVHTPLLRPVTSHVQFRSDAGKRATSDELLPPPVHYNAGHTQKVRLQWRNPVPRSAWCNAHLVRQNARGWHFQLLCVNLVLARSCGFGQVQGRGI